MKPIGGSLDIGEAIDCGREIKSSSGRHQQSDVAVYSLRIK